jgi:hypothetical protein
LIQPLHHVLDIGVAMFPLVVNQSTSKIFMKVESHDTVAWREPIL